jgi:predicted O-methyltransferase YrrM
MALSLETAGFLWWVCEERKARTVCDLGSGFSSFVLRLYADSRPGVVVHSVDDDVYWLNRTTWYCRTQFDREVDGFLTIDEWEADATGYDVILHDLAGGAARNHWAAKAVERLNPGGVVILDDAHNYSHHRAYSAVCRDYGLTMLDVFSQTIDQIGRFAACGVKP